MAGEHQWYGASPAFQIALSALEAGISVLPIRPDGSKQPAVSRWKHYQQEQPTEAEVQAWFLGHPQRGLALVTGWVSGNLIALDFDDPAMFAVWQQRVRHDPGLCDLYNFIATGYEERTPKNGRHLLFRCPASEGNQKLALRAVPEPQRFQTLAETREEGGLIIIDPSRGAVHPTGRPYVRLRGGVATIRTIAAEQRALLYASVRAFDEVPPQPQRAPRLMQPRCPTFCHAEGSSREHRPGEIFERDPGVTWESLLIPLGWQLVRTDANGESYWRHPGKRGLTHSATTNADGTNRLFCFSASPGLPTECYLTKFTFYAWWYHGGNFKEAARVLASQGYTTRTKEMAL